MVQCIILLHLDNWEFPDVQAGFRKGRGTRDQTANIHWIIEKAREFQENIYFCFSDCAKTFDCVNHNKLENFNEVGISDHFTCFLRNLYAGQEAGYVMWNAGLDETQDGLKIAGRNINNLINNADDTTFMAENEELKSLLMKVKEESEKIGLKFNIQPPGAWKGDVAGASPASLCLPFSIFRVCWL